MSRLAIRCDPQTAIATDEVEQWLQREVERFRAAAPRASFRLHHLSKTESTIATGRGMRLLGLRPTPLGTLENSDALPFVDSLHASGEPV